MHSLTEEAFDMSLRQFVEKYEHLYPKFVNYILSTWCPKKQLWSKAWRPVSFIYEVSKA